VLGPCEADVMAGWLRERGVASERLVLEREARSTAENARLVAPLLLGVARVTLVTERFHMLRSLWLLRRALGPEVRVEAAPAADALGALARVAVGCRELVSLMMATARGSSSRDSSR
jgi:uncharacterized SAM-binding protein YcdF (DUF218 family)